MLTPIKTKNIKDIEALQNFPFNSDHKILRCILTTARQYCRKPKSITLFENPKNENKSEYKNELSEILKKLDHERGG